MELLKQLYAISSPSGKEGKIKKFVKAKCLEIGAQVKKDKKGNLYVTKGKALNYPCIVAHLDEVCPHRGKEYEVLTTKSGKIFGWDSYLMEQNAIGGDDKNGIFIALKMLEREEAIKLAFFVEEETGCNGSYEANLDFFSDCRFVIQADRRGGNDFISNGAGTDFCSDEFIKDTEMQKFGYSEAYGSITDVWSLKKLGLNISVVNLSCGYYNPHTEQDYTILSELNNCLSFVKHIFENCTKVYKHEAKEDNYYYGGCWNKEEDNYYYGGYEAESVIDTIDYYLSFCDFDTSQVDKYDLLEYIFKKHPQATEAEIDEAYQFLTGETITI